MRTNRIHSLKTLAGAIVICIASILLTHQSDAQITPDLTSKILDAVRHAEINCSPDLHVPPELMIELDLPARLEHAIYAGALCGSVTITNVHNVPVHMYVNRSAIATTYLRIVGVSYRALQERKTPNASEMIFHLGYLVDDATALTGVLKLTPGESITFSLPLNAALMPRSQPYDILWVRAELRSLGMRDATAPDNTQPDDCRWLGRESISNYRIVIVPDPC